MVELGFQVSSCMAQPSLEKGQQIFMDVLDALREGSGLLEAATLEALQLNNAPRP